MNCVTKELEYGQRNIFVLPITSRSKVSLFSFVHNDHTRERLRPGNCSFVFKEVFGGCPKINVDLPIWSGGPRRVNVPSTLSFLNPKGQRYHLPLVPLPLTLTDGLLGSYLWSVDANIYTSFYGLPDDDH